MNIIIKLKASDFYFCNQIVSLNNLIKKQQQYNHKRNLTGPPFRKLVTLSEKYISQTRSINEYSNGQLRNLFIFR